MSHGFPAAKCSITSAVSLPIFERETRSDYLRVRLHVLGNDSSRDVVVFGAEGDPDNYYAVNVSEDGHWATVTAALGVADRNDVWVADLTKGLLDNLQWQRIVAGCDTDALTSARFGKEGALYLATNYLAPRGRLLTATAGQASVDQWRELLPEDPEASLDDYLVLDSESLDRAVLLASRTRHAAHELTVHDLADGRLLRTVTLPGAGTVGTLRTTPANPRKAWFTYSDYVTPPTVYHYDTEHGTLTQWARPPGAAQLPQATSRRLSFQSWDGTEVDMFMVDLPGTINPSPVLMFGYGGFGVGLQPTFSPEALAWVESRGRYAAVCARGGGEKGRDWHQAGQRHNKINAVKDFISAAEYLIAHGYTTAGQLAILGASHGGLLTAAAATRRPDLFAAVISSDATLDMIRYERFGLGKTWMEEFGTASDPADLAVLLDLSPYHQVRAGERYPAFLLTGADTDPRTDSLHVRKMCAALQHASAGEAPILMRREEAVGHGARSATRETALLADILSFAATFTGLTQIHHGHAPATENDARQDQ